MIPIYDIGKCPSNVRVMSDLEYFYIKSIIGHNI